MNFNEIPFESDSIDFNSNFDSTSFDRQWNDQIQCDEHFWMKHSSSSNRIQCDLSSCQIDRRIDYQCSICQLKIHVEYLNNDEEFFRTTRCRISFIDEKNSSKWIQLSNKHFFKEINVNDDQYSLVYRRCSHCRKKISSTFFLKCFQCQKYFHRKCFQFVSDVQHYSQCDFGPFKNLYLRPRSIQRTIDGHFRIEITSNDVDHQRENDDEEKEKEEKEKEENSCPVIVLINKLSGGQQGEEMYRQCLQLLNSRQVFLLKSNENLDEIFDLYDQLKSFRLIVCGGDGTVGWISSFLSSRYADRSNPPVAICPLGTGNDLSRVLGWGSKWNKTILKRNFQQIQNAKEIQIDRWKIHFDDLDEEKIREFHLNEETNRRCWHYRARYEFDRNPQNYLTCRSPLNRHWMNYVSLGLDGAVVLDFHVKRQHNPSSFTSPTMNKFIYLNLARKYWKEFLFGKFWNLASSMKLFCDQIDFSSSLKHCQSLLILNIQSYGSGTKPWTGYFPFSSSSSCCCSSSKQFDRQGKEFVDQRSDDNLLEILCLSSFQMSTIHLGCRAERLTQCREVQMEFYSPLPIHIDGDPFYLPSPRIIRLDQSGKVSFLEKTSK